jgi:hypothetical protein
MATRRHNDGADNVSGRETASVTIIGSESSTARTREHREGEEEREESDGFKHITCERCC